MTKSATELMQEILFAAVTDAVGALKSASRGMPNTLLRDINAIHANSTFADLPPELQATITASVRTAFNRLLKEGYSIAPGAPARSAGPRSPIPDRRPAARGPRRDGPRGDGPRTDGPRPGGPRRPRSDGRPAGGAKPKGPVKPR